MDEVSSDKIIETCGGESKVCRVLRICSLIPSCKSWTRICALAKLLFVSLATDDVRLANTEDIVVAWFGSSDPPSGHPLATAAGALVQLKKPDQDAWVKMLIASMTSKNSTVVDIFSSNGKFHHKS